MERDIELVVMDMDDVLAHLNRAYRLQLLSEMTQLDQTALQRMVWESDFEHEAEKGKFADGAEYLAEFNRLLDSNLTREQWIEARRKAMTLSPETLRIAEKIQERHKIAMLTNNGPLLLEALPEIVPDVARVFGEHAHASFQFRARKPEPGVFEGLLTRYGVAPGRAVFIDDCLEFVEGARAVGMVGIHFTGAYALRQSLSELGIPC